MATIRKRPVKTLPPDGVPSASKGASAATAKTGKTAAADAPAELKPKRFDE